MDTELLHIGVREREGTRVLKLSGELDAYSSNRIISVMDTWVKGAKKVAVDLDDLLYIDSAGLSALVWMWRETRNRGVELTICCNNDRIHRVLEITGLLKLFTLEPSISQNRTTASMLSPQQPSKPV